MPDIMTESELAELRALEAAATPGPWTDDAAGYWGDMPRIYGDGFLIAVVGNAQPERGDCWDADAKFIRAARNAIPRLLATIENMRVSAQQRQMQAERDLATARMALETRPCATDLAAANYRAKTAERERDEARVENARLRVFARLSPAPKVGDDDA